MRGEKTMGRGRLGMGLAVGVATLSATAMPAGAHHDPEQLASLETSGDFGSGVEFNALIPTDPAGTGPALSPAFVAAASLGVLVLLLAGRARRLDRAAPRGRRAVASVVAAALFALPLAAASPANAATLLLPDLISDQPDPVGPVEVNNYTGTPRLVLRFDGYVTNVGDGPLEVSGNPQITDPADPAAVHQRALDSDGDWNIAGTPLVQFETADGHNHFHLMEVGRYSLWNETKTAEAAPGQKVGFCLYDIERAEGEDYSGPRYSRVYSGSVTQFCDSNNPGTTDLVMGTSAGWRDVYGAYLTFQWVDVSETAPGIYYLANEADPFDRIVESDETNNQVGFADTSSTIPGYNALPVSGIVSDGSAVAVTLTSEQYGSPGDRRFEIVTPPDHGTLSVATGVDFSSSSVVYTPDAGYQGPDSFEYVAKDDSSVYPFNPTRAAVGISVDTIDPSVQISGAPASLIAGTSAALTATITDATGPVAWSVDGVAGGNAVVGTVDPSGLYVAPGAVPPGAVVTVRAALASQPAVYDEITITIDAVPNMAPQVAVPDDQIDAVGEAVSLALEASDPNGDPFTFEATGLPSGLSIHPNTGLITGAPTAAGDFSVSVTATDGVDDTTVDFDWLVDPRAVVTPGATVLWEGDVGTRVASIPVRLDEPVNQPVTVQWATVDVDREGIAAEGVDFVGDAGEVTFAPGETLATVDIVVNGDLIDEPPAWLGEWGLVAFGLPSANADIAPVFFGLGVFIIGDDDG